MDVYASREKKVSFDFNVLMHRRFLNSAVYFFVFMT